MVRFGMRRLGMRPFNESRESIPTRMRKRGIKRDRVIPRLRIRVMKSASLNGIAFRHVTFWC